MPSLLVIPKLLGLCRLDPDLLWRHANLDNDNLIRSRQLKFLEPGAAEQLTGFDFL